MRSETVIEVCR